MSYDINTIEELVDLLGGPSKLAKELGLGTNGSVSNWAYRGFIPPCWHLRLYVELKARGKSVSPEVLELTPEQHRILFDGPTPRPNRRGQVPVAA